MAILTTQHEELKTLLLLDQAVYYTDQADLFFQADKHGFDNAFHTNEKHSAQTFDELFSGLKSIDQVTDHYTAKGRKQ